MLRNFFDRFGRRREEANESAVIGNDGWVELAGSKLVVHDPAEEGRYATLTPEPGVRLWINDEEVAEPTAVTATDTIRYEIAVDPAQFFELSMSADDMTVELVLLGDPFRLPDTVSIVGRHQVRLLPGYSTRVRPRGGNPRQVILDRLKTMGVEYGLDEAALDQEMASPTGRPVVIARGQEAREPVPGQWVWKLDEWALVEAGQVIAAYQGGQSNQPRITVKGKVERLYEDLPEPQVYLAGNGTRIVPGGRLVASASGRVRALPTPQGQRVHIFPVERIEGDLTHNLESTADIIVTGNVLGAKVTTTGEVVVSGDVEKSEIHADVITVMGHVGESRLYTVAPGHHAPLRAECTWVLQHMEAMRETIHNHKPITEEAFREVQTFVRSVRRKAEGLGINHPDYLAASEEVAKVFLGAQAVSGIDLPTAGRLIMSLTKLTKAAEAVVGARDIRAGSLTHSTVWAGRHIHLREKASASTLAAGGGIQAPEGSIITQCELLAAGEVAVGQLQSVRKTAPVTVRAPRVVAEQVQAGCVFEFGADRHEFKSDLDAILATANTKGQVIIRHKD